MGLDLEGKDFMLVLRFFSRYPCGRRLGQFSEVITVHVLRARSLSWEWVPISSNASFPEAGAAPQNLGGSSRP